MRLFVWSSDALTRWIGVPAAKAWMWLTGTSKYVGATFFMLVPLFVDLALAFQSRDILRSTFTLGITVIVVWVLLRVGVPAGPSRSNSAIKSMSFAEFLYRFIATSFACRLIGSLALALVGAIELPLPTIVTCASALVGATMWLADNPTVRSTAKETLRRLAHRPQVRPQPVG